MAEKHEKVLQDFKLISGQLQAFLRKRPSLTDSQQLAIENCLLMLQIEYGHWRQDEIRRKVPDHTARKN